MTFSVKVAQIKVETIDTITLCLKQPGLKKIKYKPGQYLTLIFNINGRRYLRPYSFSSCPGVDEYLEITIKRVSNGIVSNHIHDIIKEGDTLEIMPPMGDFVYDFSKEVKTAYLWGVGSGITPLFSLIKSMLILDNKLRVILVYGNRHLESTIFLKEIQALVSKYNDRFKVIEFHTKFSINVNNPSYIQGRIDYKTALSIVNSDNTLESSVHYICGPVGLKESVKNALADRNIHTSQILSEDFELQKNPKDFEHIHTRTVVVNFNGHNHMLEIIKGKSILEAALDANIDLPYSCQTGNCSTCKGVAISGLSQMIGLSKLRDDLESNEFLLCCTHPLTDNVVFKI